RIRDVHVPDFDPAVPIDDQLMDIARRNVEMMVSEEVVVLARVSIPAFIHCPAFASETFNEFEHCQQGMVRWIRQAVDAGALRVDDLNLAAKQFSGLLETFAFWPRIVGGQQTPSPQVREQIAASTVQMFLSRYRSAG